MNESKEINTDSFYKELNKKNCDPEYLLKLSENGIFLMEPLFNYESIKFNEYVIDISLMNHQFFIIYTDKQYNRFMKYCYSDKDTKYLTFSSGKMNKYDLLIVNKFFINKLSKESNREFLLKFISKINIPMYIYFLYKYNIITDINIFSFDIRNNFYPNEYLSIIFALFEDYFYLKEKQVN